MENQKIQMGIAVEILAIDLLYFASDRDRIDFVFGEYSTEKKNWKEDDINCIWIQHVFHTAAQSVSDGVPKIVCETDRVEAERSHSTAENCLVF
jgi:hypothetical protein